VHAFRRLVKAIQNVPKRLKAILSFNFKVNEKAADGQIPTTLPPTLLDAKMRASSDRLTLNRSFRLVTPATAFHLFEQWFPR